MSFGALPEFHHKHRVEVIVADAHLIREATDLFEGVTALGQMSDQFITFTRDDAECSRVCKCHGTTLLWAENSAPPVSETLSGRFLVREQRVGVPGRGQLAVGQLVLRYQHMSCKCCVKCCPSGGGRCSVLPPTAE